MVGILEQVHEELGANWWVRLSGKRIVTVVPFCLFHVFSVWHGRSVVDIHQLLFVHLELE